MEKVSVPYTEEEQNIDCDRLNFSSKMENMKDIFWKIKESKNDTLMQLMNQHLESVIDYLNSQMSGNIAIEWLINKQKSLYAFAFIWLKNLEILT